jgi:hypothetical protein
LNLILGIAEFAGPDLSWLALVDLNLLIFTIKIEGGLARSAKDWISGCKFGALLESRHVDGKDIGIYLLNELAALFSSWLPMLFLRLGKCILESRLHPIHHGHQIL